MLGQSDQNAVSWADSGSPSQDIPTWDHLGAGKSSDKRLETREWTFKSDDDGQTWIGGDKFSSL